ncbi:MAG: aromatic ring-hydroxylating dioxygenase subunit alpha, partial [Acidobacteria bacterium]|nr:aromatic ring-hydroxylating dioxygenase subunit alpha [Acidobacteriota bacterium]
VLDEPVLLVRTNEYISCLTNVCTHRGKVLVEQPTDGDLIRCPYHGRRFMLDGECSSMPEFEGVVDFPAESDNLKKLPLAERGGFLFASVAPNIEFNELICDVAAHLSDIDPGALTLANRREYEVNAHWALYCENYLEGFHIPYVHHGLNKVVDYGSYTTDLFRYSSVQTGRSSKGNLEARYLFMFPNTMFNWYPWGISVNVVRPVTKDKTIVEFLTYVSDESVIGEGAGADLHSVELEDEAVVESVQRGIRSRFYSQGRYSPTREQGTHHFHRLIAEFMNSN